MSTATSIEWTQILCTKVLGDGESPASLDEQRRADLLDSTTQLPGCAAQPREAWDEPVQAGARHDVLLVQRPHAPGGQPPVRGLDHRPGEPPCAASASPRAAQTPSA